MESRFPHLSNQNKFTFNQNILLSEQINYQGQYQVTHTHTSNACSNSLDSLFLVTLNNNTRTASPLQAAIHNKNEREGEREREGTEE